jgi:ATP-dependent DNA helicase RecQ
VIIAQMLCGSKAAKVLRFRLDQLSTFGLLGHLKLPEITELIDATLAAGLLDQADVERNRPVLRLTDLGNQVMRGQTPLPESFSLSVQVARRLSGTSAPRPRATVPCDGPAGWSGRKWLPTRAWMKELRDWRRQAAAAVGWPAFRILSNAVLSRLAAEQPADLVQLLDVKGIGPIFANSYGEEVLAIIARHRTGSPPDRPTRRSANRPTKDHRCDPRAGEPVPRTTRPGASRGSKQCG